MKAFANLFKHIQMRLLLLLVINLLNSTVYTQFKIDTLKNINKTKTQIFQKPESLTNGFIDIVRGKCS